jgi:zinc and cadmium transporter
VFFFLLTKAELWHHGHEHHDHVHHHHDHEHEAHSHSHSKGGWSLLTGDSVHCFGDGVLIASAFLADMRLGVIAAVSVLAHEVPHHIGDLVVLRNSKHHNLAVLKVSLAGAVTALGGITGYFLVGTLADWLPYFLVVASSSFVYVALSDLIPQLQKRLSAKESLVQVVWLVTGIVLVTVVSGLAHSGHAH